MSDILPNILEQLTYFGSPCTQDCSGHKAGRTWELKKNKNTSLVLVLEKIDYTLKSEHTLQ